MQHSLGIIRKFERPIEVLKVLFAWFVLAAILIGSSPPTSREFWLGSASFAVAQFIRVWAAGHLTRGKALTTSGPYAYVRDPLYVGRLFWVLGLGFYSGQPWVGVVLIVIFLWFYCTKKIPKEMKNLEAAYGDPYRIYSAQVKSLLPRLCPYPERANRRWQWVIFQQNKEIWAVVIVAVVIASFWAKTFYFLN
ncbi:MAG: hypothetical protein AUJ92_08810 [Armatimonadetes bacterium CG2_30_59_28]|nr:isoprenylcysteine carboxylmethyltransferase family protein [Armatimonadota bacterium]OIO94984.1 MAG: hypothetical protein AUJ92_08810 [Armatimonadetes bacterium CG2_30_59_28]PIU66772.1 MAG: hypothetical protein COS85_03370 [Armatimonadetes bacterium CG07_land_8_20_14_0_80_59_28]PIX39071.1 MAG: hypothetical protein COZ56_18705 [Armatimonadetes bacterium CG_4_8_14_3_um_filter_58_9]PIY39331.1 MAG: hypothetical protein COZ05_19390 [Armatimonadetes bacterium CG_4_10_14_3_um_filter_59_10]PJB64497